MAWPGTIGGRGGNPAGREECEPRAELIGLPAPTCLKRFANTKAKFSGFRKLETWSRASARVPPKGSWLSRRPWKRKNSRGSGRGASWRQWRVGPRTPREARWNLSLPGGGEGRAWPRAAAGRMRARLLSSRPLRSAARSRMNCNKTSRAFVSA